MIKQDKCVFSTVIVFKLCSLSFHWFCIVIMVEYIYLLKFWLKITSPEHFFRYKQNRAII